MSFWKKLKDLFGGKEETKEAEKAESAPGEDAPIGKDELCHFTITFRHSSKSIDFEGTWRGIEEMSGAFADSKGLKMNNFYVPWDEVAFIYCGGRVADDRKGLSEAKPGDEVPATDEAKALGAETMEVLPSDGKEEPKAEAKPEEKAEAKEEEKPEEKAEGPKEEAADATRDARVDEVKAEAKVELDGISAEEIKKEGETPLF